MEKAKLGDWVRVDYTGRFEDGTVFDSSYGRTPLKFQLGSGSVIAGFEEGILGLVAGEKNSFTILPEKGYGEFKEDLVLKVGKAELDRTDFTTGDRIEFIYEGARLRGVVKELTSDSVVIDMNHPMAGKTMIFEIELIEIINQG